MDRRPGRFCAEKNRKLGRDVLTFRGYEVVETGTAEEVSGLPESGV
jgi:hypothetical protein